jgi:hypothetical protein
MLTLPWHLPFACSLTVQPEHLPVIKSNAIGTLKLNTIDHAILATYSSITVKLAGTSFVIKAVKLKL